LFDALPSSVHTIAAAQAAIGMKAFYSFTPRPGKNESDGKSLQEVAVDMVAHVAAIEA
jgi:hypothetical protein